MGLTVSGSFKSLEDRLKRMKNHSYLSALNRYGKLGVDALRSATPRDTGKTANSWEYKVQFSDDSSSITWFNTNVINGWFNVAIGLQTGHGTDQGGYVKGRDYINPALEPILANIAPHVWKEVTK